MPPRRDRLAIAPRVSEDADEAAANQLAAQQRAERVRVEHESPIFMGNDSQAEEEEEYNLLKKQVDRKRRQTAILSMRREIAGESPEIVSLSSGHKRAASSDIGPSLGSHPGRKAIPPLIYKGESLGEFRAFVKGCKVHFEAVEVYAERRRVALAAACLRELALDEWDRRIDPLAIQTWAEFEDFCRNVIADPANRMGIASLRLKEAGQGKR
ncbi:MAG: hypothetical protein Q9187_008891, partial [Circinaria calcarea]